MQNFRDRLRGALGRAVELSDRRGAEPARTTAEDLQEWVRVHLRDTRLAIVSNREPYSHLREGRAIRVVRNAGGLVVALDAVARALRGVWVAHGSGSADREVVDARDRAPCPPDNPSYTLRRVWLSDEDVERYYSGFSNGALWPLCHIVYVRPRFRLEDWERYREVNARFAEAVLDEVGDSKALVFLQDYHLGLAARLIKERRPDVQIALFWHIPWPNHEVLRILPWKRELLDGMLASDLIGFHTRTHARNFLDAVAGEFEARVDRDRMAVERGGRRTWVREFPISVDSQEITTLAESPAVLASERRLRESLGLTDRLVGLGVDRVDYTKGIPERLEALERLFEKHPEWLGKFSFIQIGVPTRIELKEYRDVLTRTRSLVRRINKRFRNRGTPAVILIERNLDFRELLPYYRMADLCTVTSLHDGMNLVAKEYLAASPNLEARLVLSPFTGAARELERAWLASPYDREGLADAYHAALSASPEERRQRMVALREVILRRNIFDWAIDVFDTLEHLSLTSPHPESTESGVVQGPEGQAAQEAAAPSGATEEPRR